MNKTNKIVCVITVYLSCLISAATVLAAKWNPIPDTGITICYNVDGDQNSCPSEGQPFYGQDAQYTSTKLAYRDIGDGTIQDYNTGLIWQKSNDGAIRTWQEAKDYCDTLVLANNSDWRLPNIFELHSILDYSYINSSGHPAINTNFFEHIPCDECTGDEYWSATIGFNSWSLTNPDAPDVAWLLDFSGYNVVSTISNVANEELTRCVCGEETFINNFSIAGNGTTVTDSTTGLEWQQNDDGVKRTWEEALSYCEDLTLAGENDWRLPNIKELNSIVDRAGYDPAINSVFNSQSDKYWSSTATFSPAMGTEVSYVAFNDGYSWDDRPSYTYYVRCVRGGLRNDEITAQNYQLGNIDPRSDRFSVWMDVSVKGQKPIEFCSYYQLSVDGDNGKGAKQILCTALDDAPSQPANTGRYRIDFEIEKDATYPTAAYFENGKMKVRNVYTGSEEILSGLSDFSVYGTTFDLTKHAWSFANRSWQVATGDTGSYMNKLAEYVDTEKQQANKDAGTRREFIESVGFNYIYSRSLGQCYGLAASAIANFTHKSSAAWGTSIDVNFLESEISNHWDKENNYCKSPYKPFQENEINSLNWKDSSKKIMYYFLSQSHYKNTIKTENWVGKDIGTFTVSMENKEDENLLIKFLLKKGRPGLFNFNHNHGGEGGHSVMLAQILRWDDKTNYILWDNEHPYRTENDHGPYVEWKVISKDGKYYPQCKLIVMRGRNTEYNNIIYELKDRWVLLPCGNNYKPSQNIYNLWNEPCSELLSDVSASVKTDVAQSTEASVSYNTPDHIEVMFIGGTINGIYNQATEEKISPVFSGTLQPDKASIQSTMGGTWHLLHLPADVTYRIEATKAADTPYAEVYGTIPYPNGTVDKLHYDHIELTETNATQFSFLIGRNNSDKTLHRTGGSDKVPDYDIILDVAITPPSGFAGFAAGGQVQLSWQNSSHPKLSLVKIVRKEGGFPASPTDGMEIYSGLGESAIDNTVQSGTLYYYAAFSMDSSGSYSDSAATAVDTARFAVTGLVTNNGTGLPNAKLEIRNSEQFPVAMTYTRADGSYVLANLENGSYTVEASVFGYSLNNSPHSAAIINANQTANFTTTAIPTLQFVFDIDKLNIGTKAQIAWKYLNINNSETLLVQKVAGETVTNLAELPASSNYFLWDVDGPVSDNVVIKISLKNNPSVSAQDTLKILPKLPATSSTPSFLPAINLLLRKK